MEGLLLMIISSTFPQSKSIKEYIPLNSPQHTECPQEDQQKSETQPNAAVFSCRIPALELLY